MSDQGIFGDSAKFPNRPDTPDFWRVAEIQLRLDGSSAEHGSNTIPLELGKFADMDSVTYHASQRALHMLKAVPGADDMDPITRHVIATIMAAGWMEGFIVGNEFHAKGGHRD
jgi:hypothetical protein